MNDMTMAPPSSRELEATRLMLAHVAARQTDRAGESVRIPVARYADDGQWQAEVDTIFKRRPVAVGFSAELRGARAYKAFDIMGIPLLLTRADDGVARAFLNVCRHRGAIVAAAGQGKARNFSCPYHGWVFDSIGRLVAVHQEQHFGCVDRDALGLRELACAERDGIIYAVLTPDMPMDLDAWIGDFDPIIAELDLDRCHFFSETRFSGPNWKLAMDGYLENYHFDVLHKNTFATFIMPGTLGVGIYGRHMEHIFCARTIEELRDQPEEQWRPKRHVGTALQLFPNTIVGFLFEGAGEAVGYKGGLVQIERVFPGPTREESFTIQTILSTEPLVGDAQIGFAKDVATMAEAAVNGEDYAMGRTVQQGMASGANEDFIFGRNELGLHHFHQTIEVELKA